jgi:hypothetical protein
MEVTLLSTVTCPCGHQAEETMPETSCQVGYECEACGRLLVPDPGDCCIFCTYGSVPCPPIQRERERLVH